MTDKQIAGYYGITDRTLRNWRKGGKYKQRMLFAMSAMVGRAEPVNIEEFDERELTDYIIDQTNTIRDAANEIRMANERLKKLTNIQ